MEAVGFFQDAVFTAFLALIVYFILPKLLSHLPGYDSATNKGMVDKAGFWEQIQEKLLPEKALDVSGLRVTSCDDYNEKELQGEKANNDDAVRINNIGCVDELKGEIECVGGDVGGGGTDDFEEQVVDESSERPILDEIQEEKGVPVAEDQVKFDLRDDLIREEKVNPASEAQVALDLRNDIEVRDARNEEGVCGNSEGEDSEETKGKTLENVKSDDHQVEEDELFGDWEGIERTELEKRFDAALAFVECNSTADRIDGSLRLQFYGLQRVAMEGPCHEPQPMALKVSARAKWYEAYLCHLLCLLHLFGRSKLQIFNFVTQMS